MILICIGKNVKVLPFIIFGNRPKQFLGWITTAELFVLEFSLTQQIFIEFLYLEVYD
jgi:hypothetical protein